MTAEDAREGWWDAPAGETWTCPAPDCGATSPIAEWRESMVGCDDCGEHDGRECPQCGEVFDHVWGARKIASATEERSS